MADLRGWGVRSQGAVGSWGFLGTVSVCEDEKGLERDGGGGVCTTL